MKSEIIAALITVGGSIFTFFLASLFSFLSKKEDDKKLFKKEVLDRRLLFYEDLIRWLPVEKLAEDLSVEKLHLHVKLILLLDPFIKHFGELSEFIFRARLYGSDEVFRELIAFQKEFNTALSEALSHKDGEKLLVNVKETREKILNPISVLNRNWADRITLAVRQDPIFDGISKRSCKQDTEGHKKTTCNEHNKNCN